MQTQGLHRELGKRVLRSAELQRRGLRRCGQFVRHPESVGPLQRSRCYVLSRLHVQVARSVLAVQLRIGRCAVHRERGVLLQHVRDGVVQMKLCYRCGTLQSPINRDLHCANGVDFHTWVDSYSPEGMHARGISPYRGRPEDVERDLQVFSAPPLPSVYAIVRIDAMTGHDTRQESISSQLNDYAAKGWRVLAACRVDGYAWEFVLERSK